MRILFGTHHLEMLAGSELFTAELAQSVQARGHQVAIFTFFKGKFSQQLEAQGLPVFDPGNADALSSFAPDIVQTCHVPCAHYLRLMAPDAVRVHAMLGVIPPLEAPPLDERAYSLWLAISEEVVDRINRSRTANDIQVQVFRNWFDEKVAMPAGLPRRSGILRVAVISNHLAPDLIDALSRMQAAREVDVDYFGAERESVPVSGALLLQYDLIVSIGRTVLLAAACGIPCIMADIHGSDGLLTADNIDRVRTVNFSGRLERHPISMDHLKKQFALLPSHDRRRLRDKVAKEYSLRARTDWLLSRYQDLLAGQREASKRGRALPIPSEGLVHAELTGQVRSLREQLEAARREIAALQAKRLDHASNK